MYKVQVTAKATSVLRHIQEYYVDVPYAYNKIIKIFNSELKRIKNNPYIGQDGRVKGTKELFVPSTNYYIVYQLLNNEIHILTFLHTSRKYP